MDDAEQSPQAELFESPLGARTRSAFPFVMSGAWNSATLLSGLLMAPQVDGNASQSEGDDSTGNQPDGRRMVVILGNKRSLNVDQWPLWGNRQSDRVIVEMFDYTCPHCRNMHRSLRSAATLLGNDLAVIALPVPLHTRCNDAASSSDPNRAQTCEIARIAVAVWLVDRNQFSPFHDWIFDQDRSVAEVRARAEQTVGADALQKELAKSTAGDYIAKHVLLYKEAGRGKLPKILFSQSTVVGEVGTGSALADMIRRHVP